MEGDQVRSSVAKSEMNSVVRRFAQKIEQSDRFPFGVSTKIDDKSGFKGHRHVVDNNKQFERKRISVSHHSKPTDQIPS